MTARLPPQGDHKFRRFNWEVFGEVRNNLIIIINPDISLVICSSVFLACGVLANAKPLGKTCVQCKSLS
jgi:hypothetical protein